MSFKEEEVDLVDEDIQGGYSRCHLVYSINECLMIDLNAKDWKRGIEVLKIVESKLKDIDLSEDIEYDKQYDMEVDKFLEWKKAEEERQKVVV